MYAIRYFLGVDDHVSCAGVTAGDNMFHQSKHFCVHTVEGDGAAVFGSGGVLGRGIHVINPGNLTVCVHSVEFADVVLQHEGGAGQKSTVLIFFDNLDLVGLSCGDIMLGFDVVGVGQPGLVGMIGIHIRIFLQLCGISHNQGSALEQAAAEGFAEFNVEGTAVVGVMNYVIVAGSNGITAAGNGNGIGMESKVLVHLIVQDIFGSVGACSDRGVEVDGLTDIRIVGFTVG